MFQLQAWVTIVTGDGPTLAEAIGIKTPGNAYRPYRTYIIKAKYYNGPNKTYYIFYISYNFKNPLIRTELYKDIQFMERTGFNKYC